MVGAQLSLTNAGSPDARLSDWSWAGYGGNAIIPSYPVVTDVTDFGARPNGLSDAAPAFQAAINFAKSRGGGTVRVPAGKFLIGKRVTIDSSRIVLKGAGTTRTILTIKTSLSGLDRRSENPPRFSPPLAPGHHPSQLPVQPAHPLPCLSNLRTPFPLITLRRAL